MSVAIKEPKATEAELTALLERKHAKAGNGGSGEYAFMSQLRNDAGFKATRAFDAATISLWPSRGFTLHIYEIKVSRSDWQRELAKPAKAEDACRLADYFTIVAPRGCVDINEVPPTWGYIEASGGVEIEGRVEGRKLRTVRSAPLLTSGQGRRDTFPAGLVVSMLRAGGCVPEATTASERQILDAEERVRRETAGTWQSAMEKVREDTQALRNRLSLFSRHSGIRLSGWMSDEDVIDIAKRAKAALEDEGHARAARDDLRRLRDQLNRTLGEAS